MEIKKNIYYKDNGCEYQLYYDNFPYPLCDLQKQAPVMCPDNYKDCPIYKDHKNINKQ